MFTRLAYIGFVLLPVGLAVAIFGAISPVGTHLTQSITLVNTPVGVDPNDYATQNLQMIAGQTIGIDLSIQNQSLIFSFDIMNQTQYYVWYGCAPECHQPLLGGSGNYSQQANERKAYLTNATVSLDSPFNSSFTAPSNGTYYFVFDNSVGSSWSTYVNRDAIGYAVGNFKLTEVESGVVDSPNWMILILGALLMLIAGIVCAICWKPTRRA
jgi:hypothetical protein